MTFIILDLEWNQPISYQSRTYREVGDKLIFEMIQIGAVRLGPDLTPAEAVSIPIAPTHYLRIHPRIRRMTGLDAEKLAGAPNFREALQQFAAWCGEDYTLLTWGCDDISVLYQNISFFHCEDIPIAPLCDIQKLFSEVHHLKDRSGLKTAMELTGIRADESMAFHNALYDAWYTALVFKTLPDPFAVLNYPQNKYIAVAKCKNHGRILIRLRFRIDDDGKKILSRSTAPATGANVAYVHTKQLQMQERQARYLQEHGALPDPDEELLNADLSSMPFD